MLASWALLVTFVPITISESIASAMNTPTRPTVRITAGVMIEAARGRGSRFISPGVSLSRPRAIPTGAVIMKLIHRIWTAEKGCPPAMLSRVATRKVTT